MATATLSEAQRAIVNQIAASLQAHPDDPAAVATVQALLETYDAKKEGLRTSGLSRSGDNMRLPKEVVGNNAHMGFGHVPGVRPGAKFKDRGQLYVAGVHVTLMKGIHAAPVKHPDMPRGAYSVVMSGVYVDDEDMGEMFWYTGEGGIDSGTNRQIKDQQMDTGANAALRRNCDTRTPVRVIRGYVSGGEPAAAAAAGGAAAAAGAAGSSGGGASGTGGGGGKKKEKGFVYEGLYIVLEYKQEPSKDGPLVCKFLMCGVPGHSTVNAKVEYGIFGGVQAGHSLHARRLAGGAGAGAGGMQPAKKARMERDRKAQEAVRKLMLADIRRLYPGNQLQSEDVSGGQEAVPIPVINEISDERLPNDFVYTREYSWSPGVYQLLAPVLRFADEEMLGFTKAEQHGLCGLAFNRFVCSLDRALGDSLPPGYDMHLEEQYNQAGCLMVTDPCGVHECGASCSSARCRLNKQLSNGVVMPLEVFMTPAKGWGVRCRDPIPAGAFVCAYVGQLVTDAMAEVRKGVDHYLFDLDFFAHIYTEIAEKGLETISGEIPLHKIPPVISVGMVRQIQANAARAQREAAAAAKAAAAEMGGAGPAAAAAPAANGAATGANGGGGAAAAVAADGAGLSTSGQQGAAAAPAAGGTTAEAVTAASRIGPDGLMATDAVAAAARDLAASCAALAASVADGADTFLGGVGTSGTAVGEAAAANGTAAAAAASTLGSPRAGKQQVSKAAALAAAAATAAADAAAGDLGTFYLQTVISRDEAAGGGAAAAPARPMEPRAGLVAAAAAASGEEEEYAPLLVVDARTTGNVGRFINHSCDGSLTIQAVFAGEYRSTLLYHVGLYACREIPAMEELTYNYGYHNQTAQASRGDKQYVMECHCGAENCVRNLM